MNHVQLAAKMYDARDSVRRLLGDKFLASVAPYQTVIRELAAANNIAHMQATITLAKDLEAGRMGMAAMVLLAAYVEMVEPSAEAARREGWKA